MSTFFATFESTQRLVNLVEELLRSGVSSDDLSLVSKEPLGIGGEVARVGDATSIVGRSDDPDLGEGIPPQNKNVTDLTTVEASPLMGIDTSDRSVNVESADQAEDSQSIAEDSLDPRRMTTHSTHEVDDLALTLKTGFPTTVPLLDDVQDSEGVRQEQLGQSLDRVEVPGLGSVLGGGSLATAALDLVDSEKPGNPEVLNQFLCDRGVPKDCASSIVQALDRGDTLLAVEIVPGKISEEFIEQAAGRYAPANTGLFDAPRFYEGGGYVS